MLLSLPRAAVGQLKAPIWVYNNWSAYDELSDRIPLTEELAMRELAEIARLQRLGVHFDYYMMDAFWFAPDGAYRNWRKPNWPDGPDRWLAECRRQGLLPGLWFGCNLLEKIDAAPAWRDSLNAKGDAMSFSDGGFLPDFMTMLDGWYDRGIRMFKFDFAYFDVATPAGAKAHTPAEIDARNQAAFRDALKAFRAKHPDAVLEAFNGFGGDVESTSGPFPFKSPVDLRWLEAFDAMYSGDPRPSDVPEMSFWRSMDIYSDHMVRRYHDSGLPLKRIDSTACMIGGCGTNYYRKTAAWRGMLLLTAARGGWINTIHGNLEYLTDDDARWLAKVQSLYTPLQEAGTTTLFGGVPGEIEPYGYASSDAAGFLYTVVNPAKRVAEIKLPHTPSDAASNRARRILFRDAGFEPVLNGDSLQLGPGQLAAIGYGDYGDAKFDLGIEPDVRIPDRIQDLEVNFDSRDQNAVEATFPAPPRGTVRIIFRQRDADGAIRRTWVAPPPDGPSFEQVLKLQAWQNDRELPVEINYGKRIWSGLSWAAGEIRHAALTPGEPLKVRCSSTDKDLLTLEGRAFVVEYRAGGDAGADQPPRPRKL